MVSSSTEFKVSLTDFLFFFSLSFQLEELEGSNANKEEFAEKLRLSSLKLCEVERNLYAAKRDVVSYQGMLEQSQVSYSSLQNRF